MQKYICHKHHEETSLALTYSLCTIILCLYSNIITDDKTIEGPSDLELHLVKANKTAVEK